MTYQRSEILLNGAESEENGNRKGALQNSKILLSQLLTNSSTPTFHEIHALGPAGSVPEKTHKCCVYIANKSKYCVRLNSIQAFSDINRDVSFHSWSNFIFTWNWIVYKTRYILVQLVGDARRLSGYTFSAHNNIIDPSAVLGLKTTVSYLLYVVIYRGHYYGFT